jgi:hypothetical protein
MVVMVVPVQHQQPAERAQLALPEVPELQPMVADLLVTMFWVQ